MQKYTTSCGCDLFLRDMKADGTLECDHIAWKRKRAPWEFQGLTENGKNNFIAVAMINIVSAYVESVGLKSYATLEEELESLKREIAMLRSKESLMRELPLEESGGD